MDSSTIFGYLMKLNGTRLKSVQNMDFGLFEFKFRSKIVYISFVKKLQYFIFKSFLTFLEF